MWYKTKLLSQLTRLTPPIWTIHTDPQGVAYGSLPLAPCLVHPKPMEQGANVCQVLLFFNYSLNLCLMRRTNPIFSDYH